MPQADFIYAQGDQAVCGTAGMRLKVSIFAGGEIVRNFLRDDATAAGLEVRECGPVDNLLDGELRSIGDVVLVDCPQSDASVMAALSRLDLRARQAGAQLIVSTSVSALDDVFACCDQSDAQILVDPSRAERVLAIGRALAQFSNLRLRELSHDDRLALLRLTEQVGEIAQRLGGHGTDHAAIFGDGRAFSFESPNPAFKGMDAKDGGRGLSRPELPDPRLIRRLIRQRQQRARHFDAALFADPAWDMLLDLTAARGERTRVSVTSLCIASGVPPTTALRWISQMTEAGLLKRVEDDTDRRRAFIALTDAAADRMARYFSDIGADTTAFA